VEESEDFPTKRLVNLDCEYRYYGLIDWEIDNFDNWSGTNEETYNLKVGEVRDISEFEFHNQGWDYTKTKPIDWGDEGMCTKWRVFTPSTVNITEFAKLK